MPAWGGAGGGGKDLLIGGLGDWRIGRFDDLPILFVNFDFGFYLEFVQD